MAELIQKHLLIIRLIAGLSIEGGRQWKYALAVVMNIAAELWLNVFAFVLNFFDLLFCILHTKQSNSFASQHSSEIVDLDVLIESLHLNGHTFRFRWTVQDLEVFLV